MLEARPSSCIVAHYDVRKFTLKSYMYREFFDQFYPDFAVPTHRVARNMYAMRMLIPIKVGELEQLRDFVKRTPSVEAEEGHGRVFCTETLRTAIVYNLTQEEVSYVALDERSLRVQTVPWERFNDYYTQTKFPTALAAKIYEQVESFSPAARLHPYRKLLQAIQHNPDKELPMAKKSNAATAMKGDDDMSQEQSESTSKKAATKKPTGSAAALRAAKKTDAPKAAKSPDSSAASMFKTLIMEGKLADDQIFKKVADKFNLDDSKRGYVKWYRNYLQKKGQNPPAPVTK